MTDTRNKSKNILIIDDSALMRRVTSDIINADGRFRVLDTASDGVKGLELVVKNPALYDVIILDINMPRMDGIEFLRMIAKNKLKIKVIVSSTIAKEGAKVTIEALELGAFDFITKPNTYIKSIQSDFKDELLRKIEAATGMYEDKYLVEPQIPLREKIITGKSISTINKLVVIASSTGGPSALNKVVTKLPKNLDAPVVIIQHMPEGFTASFANRLNEMSEIRVKEAEAKEELKKGNVYIARGGKQLLVEEILNTKKHHIELIEKKNEILKPCADITLMSLINSGYDEIVCVVLTGMGCDATNGISELDKYKKIHVIAQDKETCTVYGMPRAICTTGLVNEIVPINEIAQKIIDNTGVQ